MELIDISNLSPTSKMLDEDKYWEIVAVSLEIAEKASTSLGHTDLKNTKKEIFQEVFLVEMIAELSPKEMIGFRLRTDKFLYDTYTPEMWCAGHIMNNKWCSDDGFQYFRNWVISRGKEVYYRAKENPDSLVHHLIEDREYYDFESFWFVALDAFKNKTGKDLYDYIDIENFKTREFNYPAIELTWKSSEPETIRAVCPNLFDKLYK